MSAQVGFATWKQSGNRGPTHHHNCLFLLSSDIPVSTAPLPVPNRYLSPMTSYPVSCARLSDVSKNLGKLLISYTVWNIELKLNETDSDHRVPLNLEFHYSVSGFLIGATLCSQNKEERPSTRMQIHLRPLLWTNEMALCRVGDFPVSLTRV